ncbi:hypothetical protein [Ciceribacter azotifigens]|uniref:hypothetical protein n=1 Tax=Ciceribacter azotifigens TaxID=2069303 RepID=UPI003A8B13A3
MPAAVEDYDIDHLTENLVGLLDEFHIEKALHGPRLGRIACIADTLQHPNRVTAVISFIRNISSDRSHDCGQKRAVLTAVPCIGWLLRIFAEAQWLRRADQSDRDDEVDGLLISCRKDPADRFKTLQAGN